PALLAQGAEDELGPLEGEREQGADLLAQPGEHALAEGHLQHEQGQRELQPHAPGHRVPPHRLAVGGERPGPAEDGEEPDGGKHPFHHHSRTSWMSGRAGTASVPTSMASRRTPSTSDRRARSLTCTVTRGSDASTPSPTVLRTT